MWVGEEIQGAVGWQCRGLHRVGQEAHVMSILVTGGWGAAAEECERLGLLETAEYFRKMAAEKAFVPESVVWP